MKIKICPVHKLLATQKNRMYVIMQQYYEGIKREVFDSDLLDKQDVILLLDHQNEIQGFSTLLVKNDSHSGKKYLTIFTGDTVLDKKYWGNGALATAFGRYLLKIKVQNPFTEVYWFLISKGFKTYLLMTNNFPTHYPRHESRTPSKEKCIMDKFYSDRFKEDYDFETGLIRFSAEKTSYIKDFQAEIGPTERQNPRVRFFESKNPNWHKGDELACIAKVTIWIPFRYMLKRLLKMTRLYPLINTIKTKAANVNS